MRKIGKKVIILVLKISIVTILVGVIWGQMIKLGWVSNIISQWVPAVGIGMCSVLFEELRKQRESKKNDK